MNSHRHLLAPAALLAATASVHADGILLDMLSAITGGRGGTNLAFSDNGAVLLENPAGIANIESDRLFDASIGLLYGDTRYRDDLNDADEKIQFPRNPSPIGTISYMAKSNDGKIGYGFGIFTVAGYGTNYELETTFAGEQGYRSLSILSKFMPAISFKPTDELSIGAAVGVAYARAELDTPYFFQTGPLRGVPTLAEMQGSGLAPTWSVGMQYQLAPSTRIGISYTSETRFELNGHAEATVFGIAPTPISSRFDLEADLAYPRSIGAGFYHEFNDHHRVSTDVIWFNWSGSTNAIDLRFSDASNPAFGPGTTTDSLILDWNDSVSVRVGYEYSPNERQTFRLGYGYHPSVTPDAHVIPLIPVALEHNVSGGYTHRSGKWSVNLSYIYSFGSEQNVGTSAFAGGDFDNATFETDYHTFYAGISYAF